MNILPWSATVQEVGIIPITICSLSEVTIGEKLKNVKSKPQKYGYEYGFDENGRLIYDYKCGSNNYGLYFFITVKMCIGSVAFT